MNRNAWLMAGTAAAFLALSALLVHWMAEAAPFVITISGGH